MFYCNWCCCEFFTGYRLRGILRVDFPFRAYVNRLEQPHCLRNMRVSGARSKHTATAAPRQNRSEADFFRSSYATNPLHVHHADSVSQGFGWKRQVLGMQKNFKCERAWSDFTGAGWNCRWAGSGIERSGLLRLWAVERTPTWAGSGNSHRSAPLTCSAVWWLGVQRIVDDPWSVRTSPHGSARMWFAD